MSGADVESWGDPWGELAQDSRCRFKIWFSFHPGPARGCNKISPVISWRLSYSSSYKEEKGYPQVRTWMKTRHVMVSTTHYLKLLLGEVLSVVHMRCLRRLAGCASPLWEVGSLQDFTGGHGPPHCPKAFWTEKCVCLQRRKEYYGVWADVDLSSTFPSHVSPSYVTHFKSTDLMATHNCPYLVANLHINWPLQYLPNPTWF